MVPHQITEFIKSFLSRFPRECQILECTICGPHPLKRIACFFLAELRSVDDTQDSLLG